MKKKWTAAFVIAGLCISNILLMNAKNVEASPAEKNIKLVKSESYAGTYLDAQQTLWGINELNGVRVDKISSNVKQYIANAIYGNPGRWEDYLVLDNDNTLSRYVRESRDSAYQKDIEFKNVKTFGENYVILENDDLYVENDGLYDYTSVDYQKAAENIAEFYYVRRENQFALNTSKELIDVISGKVYAKDVDAVVHDAIGNFSVLSGSVLKIGYLGEEFKISDTINNVKALYANNTFVKEDGSVWKLGDRFSECYKIDTATPVTVEYSYIINSNHTLYLDERSNGNLIKYAEDVKTYDPESELCLKLDGTLWKNQEMIASDVESVSDFYFLKADGTLYEVTDDQVDYVIEDVDKFSTHCNIYQGSSSVYILKNDGSIWNGVPELIKEASVLTGDINNDGEISVKDVQMIFSNISKKLDLTSAQLTAADVNGDGKVTTNDMQRIFYYVNGKITEF